MKKVLPGRVEIIAVGTELLGSHFVDTNSLYLSARLKELGWTVVFKTVVGDRPERLRLRLGEALRRTDLVVVTGGLGPTRDDVTTSAVARTLGRKRRLDKSVLGAIESRLRSRGIPLSSGSKKQAYIVEGAKVLPNRAGTAPGQWLTIGGKQVILLPGPPHELKTICEDNIWAVLMKKRRGFFVRRVLKTTGLPESTVEARVADLYPKRGDPGVTVLAYPGQIEIHLEAFSAVSRVQAARKLRRLNLGLVRRLKDCVFSQDGKTLEEVVGGLLRRLKKTLAVAESCSGGLIGHRLTNVPGSSAYFLEGVIAYHNAAKIDLSYVPARTIERHGAVSPQTALAMARGIRRRARSDFGLAVTGIAGPSGGTPDKPIGLVFVALAWRGGAEVRENLFLGTRDRIKIQSAQKALDMLRRRLLLEVRAVRRGQVL
ncbi:MAG: competence/damage-inducible protein A [Candidatus Aminicenantes bacterium]|nr:competence/damage-inducible protein A [Candidatus Aminicenantes bacterium]